MALIAPDRYFNWSPASGVSEYDFEIINTATSAILRAGVIYTSALTYTYAQAVADGAVIASITLKIRAKDLASAEVGDWFESVQANPFPETALAADATLTAHTGNSSNPHSVTLAQLGAGDSAVKNVGTTAGTVAEGDHTHAAGAPAAHSHTLADISDAGSMAGQDTGVTGSFTTVDGKTVTVSNGIVTGIV